MLAWLCSKGRSCASARWATIGPHTPTRWQDTPSRGTYARRMGARQVRCAFAHGAHLGRHRWVLCAYGHARWVLAGAMRPQARPCRHLTPVQCTGGTPCRVFKAFLGLLLWCWLPLSFPLFLLSSSSSFCNHWS